MSVRALPILVVAVFLGLVTWATPGHAEKVKTNQSTKLYSRAGEQSPVLLSVKSGQTVTLLKQDGRWLKVRVGGRTGWIPRSKVDLPEGEDDVARNTRRRPFVDGRGTKRGFGGETGPDDRVGADATGGDDKTAKADAKPGPKADAKADAKAEVKVDAKVDGKPAQAEDPADEDDDKPQVAAKPPAGPADGDRSTRPLAHVARSTPIYDKPERNAGQAFVAEQKTPLYVGRTQGTWTRVSTEEGDTGWIDTSKLELAETETPAPAGRTRAIFARARVGGAVINQKLASNGTVMGFPDNYTAASTAITAAVGGSVIYPVKQRLWLGGELDYDFDMATPGIDYLGSKIGFTYHDLDARLLGGYGFPTVLGGTVLFARVGFHYDSFQVDNVADFTKNTARLPSQIVSGPTVGLGAAMPMLGSKIGVAVSVDAIAFGSSVEQTKNLEDGTGPSATAVFASANLMYHLTRKVDLQLAYDLTFESISFTGIAPATSQRGHTGTLPASGTDLYNIVSAGVAYGF